MQLRLSGLLSHAGCDLTEAGSRGALQCWNGTKELVGMQLCSSFAMAQVQRIHWQSAVAAAP